MKCPFCSKSDSKVVDSRTSSEDIIRRRRECEGCGKRFTTYERLEEPLPVVVKKDGRRENFDRLKVFTGIKKACEKRPVSTDTIEKMVDKIERWAMEQADAEIKSNVIGEKVMEEMHDLDQVAYVRFASVYRSFKDINEFMKELHDLVKAKS